MKHSLTLGMAACALLASACQETGLRGADDAGGGVVGTRVEYVPEGCDYTVMSPEVMEAGLGGEEVGSEQPIPNHIHTSWAGPSHTTFAVNWHTDLETTATHLLYGMDEAAIQAADGPTDGVFEQRGHTMMYESGIGGTSVTRVHEAHVCGLSPDTVYYYKVGAPGHWSEVFDFATAPEPGSTAPWSFAATGDSRNHQQNAWAISQRRIRDLGVDLEVFSGDAVVLGTLQNDWDLFFEASDGDFEVQDLMARVPIMIANGNHDALAVNYIAQFAFPQDRSPGERGTGMEWYSFDYANAHFVVLNDSVDDSQVLSGSQAEWLRQDLSRVDRSVTPWIFAIHHRPFHTCLSTHSPDTGLRAAWQPIFDDFEVDIVFTGHNHVYERSLPIRGLEGGQGVVAPAGANGVPVISSEGRPSGTLYVVSAGVGAPLYPVSDECPFTHTADSTRNFVHLEIDDRTINYTTYEALSGNVIDQISYTK
jgi:acid phosphatase type 7